MCLLQTTVPDPGCATPYLARITGKELIKVSLLLELDPLEDFIHPVVLAVKNNQVSVLDAVVALLQYCIFVIDRQKSRDEVFSLGKRSVSFVM